MVTNIPEVTPVEPVENKPPGLKLTRKPGETIEIGGRITLTRNKDGWKVIDGEIEIDLYNGTPGRGAAYVQAPRQISIRRGELLKKAA